jgi:hypothetical protein
MEPQNTEQGILNVEVFKIKDTSYFDIPCSIFDIQRTGRLFLTQPIEPERTSNLANGSAES